MRSINMWTVLIVLSFEYNYASAQIGLVCSKDSDCKMSASYVCGPRKTCACAKGYRFELAKFACGRHLVDQQQACDPSWDVCKGGPNAECTSKYLGQKKFCQCKEGFIYHAPTELCQRPDFVQANGNQITTQKPVQPPSGVPQGGHCTTNSDCRGFPNATCYYFVNSEKRQCDCNYDSHYFDSKAQTCLPKKGMGSPCVKLEECVNLSNIQCTSANSKQSFKTCSCKMDFYFNKEQQKCQAASEIGGSCEADEQCKARPHSFCDVSGSPNKIQRRCNCLPGREFYEGAGSCVDMKNPIPFGQPCKTSSQCQGGSNVVCKNTFLGMAPVCTCKEGYSFHSASKTCKESSDNSNSNNSLGNNNNSNNSDNDNEINSEFQTEPGQNMEVDLNFNVFMKVICRAGKCKAAKTTIMNNQS